MLFRSFFYTEKTMHRITRASFSYQTMLHPEFTGIHFRTIFCISNIVPSVNTAEGALNAYDTILHSQITVWTHIQIAAAKTHLAGCNRYPNYCTHPPLTVIVCVSTPSPPYRTLPYPLHTVIVSTTSLSPPAPLSSLSASILAYRPLPPFSHTVLYRTQTTFSLHPFVDIHLPHPLQSPSLMDTTVLPYRNCFRLDNLLPSSSSQLVDVAVVHEVGQVHQRVP